MTERAAMAPVVLGEFAGVYGVKGWLRIRSYTQPIDNILDYATWLIGKGADWQETELAEGRPHGNGLIARIAGIDDRDLAARLVGQQIAVPREALPAVGEDEFYWSDLEGLRVETIAGVALGDVDHLIETGANDVIVVRGDRERLIPFVRPEVVREVDLEARRILVDWDPDF